MCPLAPSSPTPFFDLSVRLYPYFHRFYGVRFRARILFTAPVDTSIVLVLSFFVSSLHCPMASLALVLLSPSSATGIAQYTRLLYSVLLLAAM